MNVHGDLIAANPLIVEENKDLQKRTEMHMGTDVAIERYSRATENDIVLQVRSKEVHNFTYLRK
jgi:hypothetical protein